MRHHLFQFLIVARFIVVYFVGLQVWAAFVCAALARNPMKHFLFKLPMLGSEFQKTLLFRFGEVVEVHRGGPYLIRAGPRSDYLTLIYSCFAFRRVAIFGKPGILAGVVVMCTAQVQFNRRAVVPVGRDVGKKPFGTWH